MVRTLIGSRYSEDVEALLKGVPSEVEVIFFARGGKAG